ncbi:hypothetical protein BC941DRAFT_407198 [Chlamydoabsidia padenii]|nr:hypothetical protein BC941DRAFT_407198 [Chlamydoabsidia padenii]
MFTSIFERLRLREPVSRKRRSSSLQGSLPTLLSTTTCIDFKPLLPLTITDPINVPLRYHDYGITYGSSLDSLSTSKTSSLSSSSSSSLLSFSTDDGLPPTFTDPPFMVQSCGDDHNDDEDRYPHSLSAIKSISAAIEIEPIKSPLVETLRHSLAFIIASTPPTVDHSTTDTPLNEDHDTVTPPKHHYHHDRHYHHYQHYYTRSVRENPDHLRMIVAEVNMMRVNKLISPLRPRAILLERPDPFIPCTPSPLKHSI